MFRIVFDPAVLALTALVGLQIVPIFLAVHRRRISFLSVVMAGNFVAFSANKLFELFTGVPPASWPADVRAETVALVGAHLLVIAGYRLTLVGKKEKARSHPLRPSPISGWQAFAAAAFIAWMALVPAAMGWQQLAAVTESLLLVMLFFSESSRNPLALLIARAGTFMVAFVVFIQCGLLSFAVTLSILGAIRCLMWRRVPHAISLLLLILSMGLLQPIKSGQRNYLLRQPQSGFAERAKNAALLLQTRWANAPTAEINTAPKPSRPDVYFSGFRRVGDDSLGKVLVQTPNRVPYWRGESYRPLFYLWIPRIFWQSKPSIETWHTFGKKYGYLQPTDPFTSVTFNYLAEAFMNFGMGALIAAAILFGGLVGLSERTFTHLLPGQSAASFAIFVLPFAVPADTTSILSALIFSALLLSSARAVPRLVLFARKFFRPVPVRSWISRAFTSAE